MAGLAPTLIIVRVAYGKSVDNVDQVMSIHFADRGAGHTTINIVPRSQDDNTEPTDGGEEKMGDVPRRMV
ncbi:hypothetical protein PQX77_007277 [Marasmius sp. AFHP31]|nr:hypothetical protein PQX77_007277 [Marasmius sp. AFHP31]